MPDHHDVVALAQGPAPSRIASTALAIAAIDANAAIARIAWVQLNRAQGTAEAIVRDTHGNLVRVELTYIETVAQ